MQPAPELRGRVQQWAAAGGLDLQALARDRWRAVLEGAAVQLPLLSTGTMTGSLTGSLTSASTSGLSGGSKVVQRYRAPLSRKAGRGRQSAVVRSCVGQLEVLPWRKTLLFYPKPAVRSRALGGAVLRGPAQCHAWGI